MWNRTVKRCLALGLSIAVIAVNMLGTAVLAEEILLIEDIQEPMTEETVFFQEDDLEEFKEADLLQEIVMTEEMSEVEYQAEDITQEDTDIITIDAIEVIENYEELDNTLELAADYGTLTVNPTGQTLSVEYNETTDLIVTATTTGNEENLTYEWYVIETALNMKVGGMETSYIKLDETTEKLTVTGDKTKSYLCEVSDGISDGTALFNIQVDSGFSASAVSPSQITVAAGETAELEVSASTETGSVNYKWYFNQLMNYGNTMIELQDTGNCIQAAATGTYICWVSDGINKRVLYFDVHVTSGLKVNTENTSYRIEPNEEQVLTVDATAGEGVELEYSWYKHCKDENNGTAEYYELIPEETGESITVPGISAEYKCVVNDGYGFSDVCFWTEVDSGLSLTVSPVSVSAKYGDTVTLTADASTEYGDKLEYRWFDLTSGKDTEEWGELIGTENILTLNNVTETGPYLCRVNDGYNYEDAEVMVEVSYSTSEDEPDDGNAGDEENDTLFDDAMAATVGHSYETTVTSTDDLIYYEFIPEKTGVYTFYSTGTCTTKAALYDEYGDLLTYQEFVPEWTICDLNNFCLSCELEEGQAYYLEVGTYGGAGTFHTVFSDLSAVTSNGESFGNFDVVAGKTATMIVTAGTVGENRELTYTWYDWEGNQIKSGSDNTCETEILEEIHDFKGYLCTVSDGNLCRTVYFGMLAKDLAFHYEKSVTVVRGGEEPVLTVEVEGGEDKNLEFQWMVYNKDIDDYVEIDGETSSSYIAPSETANYMCVVYYETDDGSSESYLYIEVEAIEQDPVEPEPDCNHNSASWLTEYDSTCTETGLQILVCDCGEELEEKIIPVKGHNWNSGMITTEASCTEKGIKTYTCQRCWKTKTENLSAKGHTWNTGVITTNPSCTKTGIRTYTCQSCHGIRTENVPILGHNYGNWSLSASATVFQAEIQKQSCTRCGKTETRTTGEKLDPTLSVNASKITLKTKQSTTKLKVTGLAAGDYIKLWESSNKNIFTVNSKGKITAKNKAGKATLTVTLASGLKKTIPVTVQKTEVKTTSIKGLKSKMTLEKGKKVTLSPVLNPITSVQKITYSSSNKKVATVSSKGVITAKTAGKAKITVKSGSKKYTVTVTVSKVKTKKITGVKEAITLKKGKTYTLKAKLSPKNSDEKITYKTSNKKIATVSSKGKIKGIKKGTATITLKSGSVSVKCNVTVK